MFRDQIPPWLIEADPARDAPRHASPGGWGLAAILTSPRAAAADDAVVPSPVHPRAIGWSLAAAAVLVACAVTAATVLAPPHAVAQWALSPTQPSLALARAASESCEAIDGSDAGPQAEPVIVDQRGPHVFALIEDDGELTACFVSLDPAGVLQEQGTLGVGLASDEVEPPQDSATLVSSLGVSRDWRFPDWPDDAGGEYTFTLGRAGESVVAVEATTGDGQRVSGTVSGGWWAIWVPSAVGFEGEIALSLDDRRAITLVPCGQFGTCG